MSLLHVEGLKKVYTTRFGGRGAQRSETPHSKRAVPVLSAFFTYGTAACSRTSAHS